MMQAWNRLDRALLLRWPTLWLARIHTITVAGVTLALLMCLTGFALPVGIRRENFGNWVRFTHESGPINTALMLAAMASLMLTICWAYLLLRSKDLIPSFGRRWIFPVYLYSVVVLNLGPFLMVKIYSWRYSRTSSSIFGRPELPDLQDPTLLIALVVVELLAILTAARSVNGWMLLRVAGGVLISAFLLIVSSGRYSYVIAMVVLITGYVLAGLLSFIVPLSNLRLVLISTSVFHLLTPLFPLLVMVLLSTGNIVKINIDDGKALEILLWTALGYLAISYPLERRLARLRAIPS